MARLSSTAALFLVLSGIPGTTAPAGWSEGHRIQWPPELRARSRSEQR